ncbi:MAG: hypothetical protein QM607_00045 [Microbacterium sp.]
MNWRSVLAVIGAIVAVIVAWWLIGWLWHLMFALAKFGVAVVIGVIIFFALRAALTPSGRE